MDKKYKLTNESIVVDGRTLYRIESDYKIGFHLKPGTKGGFIEKAENLSQDDYCWVEYGAMVYGKAKVFGNAKVKDGAIVCDNAVLVGASIVKDSAIISGNARIGSLCVVDFNVSGDTVVNIHNIDFMKNTLHM